MMRKILYRLFISVCIMLAFASCTGEDMPMLEVPVTFRASFQPAASRASADEFTSGGQVDTLYCAVYEKKGDEYAYVMKGGAEKNNDGKFTYSPMLIKDKTYKIVFWAMKKGAYTINDNLTRVTIPQQMECNDPSMDAFTGQSEDIVVGASEGVKEVVLERPFALLNFSTEVNDLNQAMAEHSINVVGNIQANVLVEMDRIATSYNALTGVVTYSDSQVSYTYSDAGIRNVDDENKTGYSKMTSCYVWPVEGQKAICTIEFKNDGNLINKLIVTNVPLTSNYITNIYGELLMGPTEYNVTVQNVQTTTASE